ncbi:MAG: acyl-CoA thioesterase, partial [Xanthomarina sp.]
YGDIATIKTIYMDNPAAKMVFRYEIYNQEEQLVCTGETVQVFVDKIGEGDLWLTIPSFFMDWKKNVGLLDE